MTKTEDIWALPPFPSDLGIELIECTPMLVRGAVTVTAGMANRNGVMHGGALMSFADTLGGVASTLNLKGKDRTTTLESNTNFLRPIAIGARITGRCLPLHLGRKTMVWQITIFREDEKPAAITTQTQLTLEWSAPTQATD
ncbi:MAG: PaaI family thioesterase [Paracoccaceae bacterium]